jgi:hypothetical protein
MGHAAAIARLSFRSVRSRDLLQVPADLLLQFFDAVEFSLLTNPIGQLDAIVRP